MTTAQAREFTLPGFTFRQLAAPSLGSTELAVWSIRVEPGAVGQPHTLSREEVFTLVSGTMTGAVDDRAVNLIPGTALAVQPGELFSLRNDGSEPAEIVACTSVGLTATLDGQTITPPWTL